LAFFGQIREIWPFQKVLGQISLSKNGQANLAKFWPFLLALGLIIFQEKGQDKFGQIW
jgi:hypothetical protein